MSLELEGFAEDFQAKSWHFQRHSSRIRKDEKLLEGCLCMRTFIIDSRMEKNTHESVNDIQLHSCSFRPSNEADTKACDTDDMPA